MKEQSKKYLVISIVILFLLLILALILRQYYQEKVKTYLVTLIEFNLRDDPDSVAENVGDTQVGKTYRILDTVVGSPTIYGNLWYKIETNPKTGESAYIVKSSTNQQVLSTKDAELLNNLNLNESFNVSSGDFGHVLKKFPESYHKALIILHYLQPEWTFEPFYAAHTWDDVLAAETSKEDKNLVQYSEDNEYLAKFAWMVKNDTVYDGNNWVPANKEAIAYYMDPRNFLNYEGIFQFMDLSSSGERSSESVKSIFSGNEYLLSFLEFVMDGAKDYGMLPEAVASRIMQEVAIGDDVSISAKGLINHKQPPLLDGSMSPGFLSQKEQLSQLSKLEARNALSLEESKLLEKAKKGEIVYQEPQKFYNFFNIGAYPDTSVPMGALLNGSRYAAGLFEDEGSHRYENLLLPWTSPERAIKGGIYFIKNDYIALGQRTAYLQRFDLLSGYYNHQYMQALFAANTEGQRLYQAWKSSGASWENLNFIIPIFENMPESTLPREDLLN